MPGKYSLILGQVTFDDLEVPQNLMLGGTQNMAVHDFPGGIRTVQTFGSFPREAISWDGILLGPNAHPRTAEIDRLRVTGQQVDLTYSQWQYSVVVAKFEPDIKNQWLVNYHIEVIPSVDNSAGSVMAQPTPPPENTVLKSLNQMNQKANAPTNGYTFPSNISSLASGLQNILYNALQQSGGTVGAISATNQAQINKQVASLQSALLSLINGTDPKAASAALDLNNIVTVLGNISAGPPKLLTKFTVNNPNLFQIASQIYGDSSLWYLIAQYNGLTDPMPIGQYTLFVPVAPGSAPLGVTTFLPKGPY